MGLLTFSAPTAYSVGEFGTSEDLENREMPSGFILLDLSGNKSKSANLSVRSPVQKLKASATSLFKRDRLMIICLCDRQ